MGAVVSRFVGKITRTKIQDEDDKTEIDFINISRRLPLYKSVQLLLSVCFNCALFVVVGFAVKSIAGPAMMISIILGALIAMLNNLSLTELCTRFPDATSFYSIIYKNVGELCAFTVGWFRLFQNIFMISVVSVTAGQYIYYLAQPSRKTSWLPSHTYFAEIQLDTLVFTLAFLAVLSLIVAAGLPYFSLYLTALFWTTIATFFFMLMVIIYYASSLDWVVPSEFQPFDAGGTIQGAAITTFFFTYLDKVVEQTVHMKQANHMVPISLAISLLAIFMYYLCSTIFINVLVPIAELSQEATIPETFAQTTFHNSKYILSSVAMLIFCLTIIESYFGAQKLFNILAEDGLLHQNFANQPNPRNRVPALSVLVITVLAVPAFIWLPVESLVQGFCISSLVISIAINCTAIVVQYRPVMEDMTEKSAFPNWECTKNLIKRFILCFGYVTHKRVLSTFDIKQEDEPTEQTSKLVNWSVVSYIPSCIGLSLAMFHGLPVIGWKRWIVLAALGLLTITLFLTIRIILIQPRGKACFFQSSLLASLIPLINIGLFTILLATMDWKEYVAVGIWLTVGLLIYFLYGISHSTQALFSRFQELNETSFGRVRFDSAPQLSTSLTAIQPENMDADSEEIIFSVDNTHHFPQKYSDNY